MGAKERHQVIPKEYNHESKLQIDVEEGGKREFDFELPLKN
jgi:hypothetical protein